MSEMRLVIDSNRLMAGLLKASTSRRIILHDHFSFYAPDYIKIELSKHREYLKRKAKLTDSEFDTLLQILLSQVKLVPYEEFEQEYYQSMEIMEPIEENDSSFLAVGLSLKLDAYGLKTGTFTGRIL